LYSVLCLTVNVRQSLGHLYRHKCNPKKKWGTPKTNGGRLGLKVNQSIRKINNASIPSKKTGIRRIPVFPPIGVARDFLWGALSSKRWQLFLVVVLNTQAKLLNWPLSPSNSPAQQKLDFLLCLGVHLQLTPIDYVQIFFAPGGTCSLHPAVAPTDYAYTCMFPLYTTLVIRSRPICRPYIPSWVSTRTGWPKNWHNFLYASTLANINGFSKLFHCQNKQKICNNTITKDPYRIITKFLLILTVK